MGNILITGARAPAALDLARKFKSQGNKVIVVDSIKPNLAMYSNSVDNFYLIPKPRYDLNGFIKFLIEIVKKEKIDLIIPTCEEIFYIAMRKKELEKYTKVFSEDISKLEILHNKLKFVEVAKKYNLSVPKTIQINSIKNLEKHHDKKDFILKKTYSRFASDVLFSKNAIISNKLDFNKKNPWLRQERIYGKQYCTYSIASKGKLLAHSCYPVEFTLKKGACLNFKNFKNIKISKWIEKFVKEYDFTGQIAFDFIIKKGVPYAIECNPRSTSGVHLFCDTDRLDLSFLEKNKKITYASGKNKIIALGMLTFGLMSIKNIKILKKWIMIIKKSEDIVYSKKDKSPFFRQFGILIHYLFKSLKNKSTISKETTEDIEWNGK